MKYEDIITCSFKTWIFQLKCRSLVFDIYNLHSIAAFDDDCIESRRCMVMNTGSKHTCEIPVFDYSDWCDADN